MIMSHLLWNHVNGQILAFIPGSHAFLSLLFPKYSSLYSSIKVSDHAGTTNRIKKRNENIFALNI